VTDAASADLERDLSDVAVALFERDTVDGTLHRITELAVATIDGCDLAGIFAVENHQVVTSAYSDDRVVELDRMQFDTDEGPCLDAVSKGASFYASDLADDTRWPEFGPAAAAAGIRSLLAFPLPPGRLTALNLYAYLPEAFGATDRAVGVIFATLAGLALAAAEDHAEGDRRADNLVEAMLSREIIGQAQGILIERERITADQAFELLRRASQHLNIKLREVAQTLVDTGEVSAESD
jgi:GAF domain-containing protein